MILIQIKDRPIMGTPFGHAANLTFGSLLTRKKEDYYYPEGELQNNGVAYFCTLSFIHQTNRLHINVYPLEYESVPDASRDRSAVVGTIKGECVFSNDSLVFKIDTVTGILHGEIPTTLTFRRSSIEETPCTF